MAAVNTLTYSYSRYRKTTLNLLPSSNFSIIPNLANYRCTDPASPWEIRRRFAIENRMSEHAA